MCPVIFELQKVKKEIRPLVIVTGQHKEMLNQILTAFDIQPHYDLDVMEKNQSLSRLTEKVISALDNIFIKEKPDYILVQGDTTTSFASSVVAFYHKIRIGHVEAGLRTFRKYNPFPEEINRKLISVLCDDHFAPTQSSAENLMREGIVSEKIQVTGNTVIDALFYVTKQFSTSWEGFQNRQNRQVLLTAHRRENFGQPLNDICKAIKLLVHKYNDIEITYPVHKNPNVRKVVYSHLSTLERVNLIEPVDYFEFVGLMNDSYLILTDSGGIQEEAPSLGKPVLVLRSETERPEAVDAGTVKIVGTDVNSVVNEASHILDNDAVYLKMASAINPYGDGKASQRIVEHILSNNK